MKDARNHAVKKTPPGLTRNVLIRLTSVDSKPPPDVRVYCDVSPGPQGQGEIQHNRDKERQPKPKVLGPHPFDLVSFIEGAP
jgi:hypothetical protein